MCLVDGTVAARRAASLARVLTLLVNTALEEPRTTCRTHQSTVVVYRRYIWKLGLPYNTPSDI